MPLQRFIFPDETRADRTALYTRWQDGEIRLARPEGRLPIVAGTTVDFATYFNAFSRRKWCDRTGLRTLALRVSGSGWVRIILLAVTQTYAATVIVEDQFVLSAEPREMVVPDLQGTPGELVACEVTAIEGDAEISEAAWVTYDLPRRPVRLAAVITTFRRERAVEIAMRRFARTTIPGVEAGTLHLYVIDNGQTLSIQPPEGVTVLANRNLGGAGGFTRGLLEAMKSGRFTHVLFMDDDASCEPESVWRTMAFLARLRDARTALSGAMLHTDRPTIQYEKGAVMRRHDAPVSTWRALRHYRDVADPAVVASNEEGEEGNYGAWWFFAFPLSAVKWLPFPFFVRGDDVDFSLANDLPIVTLNGVACWSENFGYKLNPATEYLAWRSWLALQLLHSDAAGARRTLKEALRCALRLGNRFDYASMEALLDGVELVLSGPEAFGREPAPLEHLKEILRRLEPATLTQEMIANSRHTGTKNKRFQRLTNTLLLGGHLLPERLTKGRLRHTRIAWEAGEASLFRSRIFAFGIGRHLTAFERNRRRFLAGLRRVIRLWWVPRSRLVDLCSRYREMGSAYRELSYWHTQLGLLPDPPTWPTGARP